jgi:hypothetical protein
MKKRGPLKAGSHDCWPAYLREPMAKQFNELMKEDARQNKGEPRPPPPTGPTTPKKSAGRLALERLQQQYDDEMKKR